MTGKAKRARCTLEFKLETVWLVIDQSRGLNLSRPSVPGGGHQASIQRGLINPFAPVVACGWDQPAHGYLDLYNALAPGFTPVVIQQAVPLAAHLAERPAAALPALAEKRAPRRQSQRRSACPLGDGLPAATPA